LSIVIHFPFWLGDCLMSFPFAHELSQKYKDQKIIAVIEPALKALVEKLNPSFEIWAYSKSQRKELTAALKKEKPQKCYLLTNSIGSYLPYIKARIPKRIGHGSRFTRFLLSKSFYEPSKKVSQGLKNLKLLEDYRGSELNKIIDAKVDTNSKPHLLLFPGAKYGPAKKWHAKSYANVINILIEENWNITIMGTADEIEDAEEITSLLVNSAKVENLCGKLKMNDLIDYFETKSNLIALANDSGAFHLLSACGVPSLGLYFSTSSNATPPAFGRFEFINADIACKPCFARECPHKHYNCRDTIHVDDVTQQLKLLAKELNL
jgi:heptosyltransferase II